MITIGIAFLNNVGKFTLKSLGTSRGGRPPGTLPQTFTCERVRVSETDGQADRQPTRENQETESKRGEGRADGREGSLPPSCRVSIATRR